jgi:hypothetical protein
VDCGFNAWGGKYPPWDLDDAIPAQMAAALGLPRFDGGMILEGGSIDVNGAGAVLTTEQCLLNENRNPELSRADIEERLGLLLGVSQVLWLGDGIVGDDTDGHIDDITRFVAEDTVVTVVEPDRADPNHAPLAENLARLRDMRLADGRPLQDHRAAHAGAGRTRRRAPARQLRQLLHRQRRGAAARLRPARRRAGRAHTCAVLSRAADRADPRQRAGGGARRLPLPDAAGAGGRPLSLPLPTP